MKLAMDSSSCHSDGGRDGWVGSRRRLVRALSKRGSDWIVWNIFLILVKGDDESKVGILTR
jgi:hypothetical protein